MVLLKCRMGVTGMLFVPLTRHNLPDALKCSRKSKGCTDRVALGSDGWQRRLPPRLSRKYVA